MAIDTLAASPDLAPAVAAARARTANRYFQVMSIVLLVIVLTGFSRTFFLRSLFQVPPLALHVYAHALVMTGWFALFFVQTSLVAAGRTDLHRQLGILGAVWALLLVVVTSITALGLPAHFKVDQVPNGIPMTRDGMIGIVWGNFGSMLFFSGLVITALALRRRPDTHKRLMLVASMVLVGPALGRYVAYLNIWKAASSVPLVATVLLIVTVITIFALPLTLVAHDLRTARRLHPATLYATLSYFAVAIGFNVIIPATAAGRALVISMQ